MRRFSVTFGSRASMLSTRDAQSLRTWTGKFSIPSHDSSMLARNTAVSSASTAANVSPANVLRTTRWIRFEF